MLRLSKIIEAYPPLVRGKSRGVLREYIQYKMLQAVFSHKLASKLAFLGGTALRIVHGSQRFSEDLDFDNFGLSEEEFLQICEHVKRQLELDGLEVEIRNVVKGAYRCYVRIPGLLYEEGLSGYVEEKVLVQIDTVPHNFAYTPDQVTLSQFDVLTKIFATPKEILLAQKIYCAFHRKRPQGRDFYDLLYLWQRDLMPNFAYLEKTVDISRPNQLPAYFEQGMAALDFKELAKDVQYMLFRPEDLNLVEEFPELIRARLKTLHA